MEFSPRQAQALQRVSEWLTTRDQPFFYLAGYAGTGKTTLAKYLTEGIDGEVIFAAFTGKAASVLRKAGCPNARTLHSLIYLCSDDMRVETLKMLQSKLMAPETTPREREEIARQIEELRKRPKGPVFHLNPESDLRYAKLLVLDECSMVNTKLAEDALSFNVPILVLGDPAQLPPVHGNGYFTSHEPDYLLTEIHRQAAENPIIRWATTVREGGRLPFRDDGAVRRIRRGELNFDALPEDVQVLTGKNIVRRDLNRRIRASQGRFGELPEAGDKLVCLKNNAERGLLNGVICHAADHAMRVDDEMLSIDVVYDGMLLPDLPVAALPFEKYLDPEADDSFIDRYLEQFDYGYALTVHKAQGSQWDDVILADDGFAGRDPGLRRKWLYTAITRASERLTIVA